LNLRKSQQFLEKENENREDTKREH
jgi:hypothetical protein